MEDFEWSDWVYVEEGQEDCPPELVGKDEDDIEIRRHDGERLKLLEVGCWVRRGYTFDIHKYRYKIRKQQTGYAGADELGESGIALADTSKTEVEKDSPWDGQVGGSHYTDLKIQPLYRTLVNKGYGAFSGACYTKIDKYTTRTKDSELEQLKKARHVLDLWIYEAEQKEKK